MDADLKGLIKELRRVPLFRDDADPYRVRYDRLAIEQLIPHRPPFLLIDAVDRLDRQRQTIRGSRFLAPDDPVFVGHFPDHPVYPGVLQVETMGQLALCLAGLLQGEAAPRAPFGVRATRIHHALYIEPVGPGDRLTVMAGLIADTGLTAMCAGQIYRDDTLCACAVQEVCYVG
jgi:3-hydroxyacyl-[acyl-carrier-protein] dehydratase